MTAKSQILSIGQQISQTRLRVCSIDTLSIDRVCRLKNTLACCGIEETKTTQTESGNAWAEKNIPSELSELCLVEKKDFTGEMVQSFWAQVTSKLPNNNPTR